MDVPTEREERAAMVANVGRVLQRALTIAPVRQDQETVEAIEKALEVVEGFDASAAENYADELLKMGETPNSIRRAAKADDANTESARVLRKVLRSLRESERLQGFAQLHRDGPAPRERFNATTKPYDFGSTPNLYNKDESTSDQLEAFASQLRSFTTIP